MSGERFRRLGRFRLLTTVLALSLPVGFAAAQTQEMQPAQSPPPGQGGMRDLPSSPPPSSGGAVVIDDLKARDELLWQRAEAKLTESAQLIDEAIAEQRFNDARMLAERALQAVESARVYALPASRYDAARARALELRQHVADSYNAFSAIEAARQRDEIAQKLAERQALQERLRTEKVEQLFNTAMQLQKERRYNDAAEAVRQIIAIDPSNDKARFALDVYEQAASLSEQVEIGEETVRSRREIFAAGEEALIPWSNDILYPKNWLELSARRDGFDAGAGQLEEDAELNRKLEDLQPEISFTEQPFDQVVEFLVDLNKLNINVDWDDLENSGVERDKAVTINLKNVALRTALNEILSQVGGDVALAYGIGDGLLRIATKEKLDKDKFILVYDIRDLLVEVRRFTNSPRIDLTQQTGGGGGGGGQSIFGGEGGGEEDEEEEDGEGDNERVEEILDIIRQTVEPDSWRETAGGTGALRELNGQLIVYNTSNAQRQIRDLLGQLRLQRALMIGVEARFLSVTSNFLEEMGVDLDFVFNAGNAGFDRAFNSQGQGLFDPFSGSSILVPRQFSQAGVFPAVPAVGQAFTPGTPPGQVYQQAGFVPGNGGVVPFSSGQMTPVPLQQGSLGLVDPTQFNTGIPGSISQGAGFAPALNIAGSFLDNLQVDFLIRATQANRRSSIVQAPRLMMFNGQRAWVAITRDRQYVGSVTAQVAEGAVGVQPVVNNISSGSSLDVDGTISADRKYVTLTVRVGFAGEPTLERFEVQRASGNSPGIFITLTDQERQAINTSVTIPDGGTVLIGGLKQVGEIEVEAGVPVLSKIPLLKRAFTNTTTIKDTQTLLILLKSKIIIPAEAEEEAFPTFSRGQG